MGRNADSGRFVPLPTLIASLLIPSTMRPSVSLNSGAEGMRTRASIFEQRSPSPATLQSDNSSKTVSLPVNLQLHSMHCDAGRLESNGFERQAGLVLPKDQYQALRAQGVVRDTPS